MKHWFGKLSVAVLMFFGSIFMLVGCGNPYSGLSIKTDNTEVYLYVDTDENGDLVKTSQELTVSVDGAKSGVSTDVLYEIEDKRYAKVESVKKDGNKSILTIVPEGNTIADTVSGTTYITLTTKEGNKQTKVKIIVEKKIKNVSWSTERIGIQRNSSLNLYNWLVFDPIDTSENKMEFTLLDDESKNNANITEDGILTINSNASFVNNKDDNGVGYVNIIAKSKNKTDLVTTVARVYVIDVINVKNFTVRLEQSNATDLDLKPNSNNEYSIMLGKENIGNLELNNANILILPSDNSVVNRNYSITVKSISNSKVVDVQKFNETFNFSAINAGKAVVEFNVEYNNYEGQFTQTIKVNVEVKEKIPTSFEIINETLNEVVNENDLLYVFDTYNKTQTSDVVADYLKLRVFVNSDLENLKFRVSFNSNGLPGFDASKFEILNSKGENIEGTLVENGSYIYIKHKVTDESLNDMENWEKLPQLKFTMQFNLNPNGNTADEYNDYQKFEVKERVVNLVFKRGVFLDDENMPLIKKINLAERKDINTPDSDKIVLLTLPEGTEYGDIIKSIVVADDSLVTIQVEGNVVYIVPNSNLKTGTTTIEVQTLLGQNRTCEVSLFIPNAYRNYIDLQSSPFFITTKNYNESIGSIFEIGYSYFSINPNGEILQLVYAEESDIPLTEEQIATNAIIDELNKSIYNGGGYFVKDNVTYYKTINQIIFLTNSTVEFNAYNFIVDQENAPTPYLLKNNEIVLSISSSVYGKTDGESLSITTNNVESEEDWSSENPNSGVNVNFAYLGVDESGNRLQAYTQNKFGIKIVKPIRQVQLNKNLVELYMEESVGALKQNLSSFQITITNSENGKPLVDAGNESLKITYQLTDPNKVIYNIIAGSGTIYSVKVDDIIEVSNSGLIKVRISADLNNFILENNIVAQDVYKQILQQNINVKVTVGIQQFNKPILPETVTVSIKYAEKVNNILTNVTSKGMYFSTNKTEQKTVKVNVERGSATNKNVYVLDPNGALNFTGLDEFGRINLSNFEFTVSPKQYAGAEFYIYLASEDSAVYKNVNGEMVAPDINNLKVSDFDRVVPIRVKIADGSDAYPYEIYNANDLMEMGLDKNKNKAFVLANDVDLSNYSNFASIKNFEGKLNGQFRYISGEEVVVEQNYITNLKINAVATSENNNFGLFANLKSGAEIKNLIIQNANITVNTNLDNINVGVVAGTNEGKISNVIVNYAKINVQTANVNNSVNVGGIVGVNNYYIQGNLEQQSDVEITINCVNESKTDVLNEFNVGAVAGLYYSNITDAKISNFDIATSIVVLENNESAINAENVNVGGIVGKTSLSNNKALIENNSLLNLNIVSNGNVGGIVGFAEDVVISNNNLQYGSSAIKPSINVAMGNVGGIVGYANNNVEVKYSYLNNFNANPLDGINYLGNITIKENINSVNAVYVGGIIGFVNNNVNINNSYVSGDIYSENSNAYIGYFIGGATQENKNACAVENSYFIGNVKNTIESSNALLPIGTGKELEQQDAPKELSYVDSETGETKYVYYYIQTSGVYFVDGINIKNSYVKANYNVGTSEDVVNISNLIRTTDFASNVVLFNDNSLPQSQEFFKLLPTNALLNNAEFDLYVSDPFVEKTTENVDRAIMQARKFVCSTCKYEYKEIPEDGVCENPDCESHSNETGKATFIEVLGDTEGIYNALKFVCPSCGKEYDSLTPDGLCDNTACTGVTDEDKTLVEDSISSPIKYICPSCKTQYIEMTDDGLCVNPNCPAISVEEKTLVENPYVTEGHQSVVSSILETAVSNLSDADFKAYGFNIANEGDQISDNTVWFKSAKLNNNLPVLFKENSKTDLLLTVIPTVVDYEFGNVNYSNTAFIPLTNKAIVFYNTSETNSGVKTNEYEIVKNVGGETTTAVVKDKFLYIYFGSDIQIDGINFDVYNSYTITASNSNVKFISNSLMQTLATGYTTLTIQSVIDESIKAEVQLFVTTGVSDVNIYKNGSTGNSENIITGRETEQETSLSEEMNLIVNEEATYYVDVENIIENVQFTKSTNIGYILEIKSYASNIKTIKLNDEVVDLTDTYKQFVFENLGSFKISTLEQGTVMLKITPYIKTTEEFNSFEINGDKIGGYLLNNLQNKNLTKYYLMQIQGIAEKPQLDNTNIINIDPYGTTKEVKIKYTTPNVVQSGTDYVINEKLNMFVYNEDGSVKFNVIDLASVELNVTNSLDVQNQTSTNTRNIPLYYKVVSKSEIVKSSNKDGMYEVTFGIVFISNSEWFKYNIGGISNYIVEFSAETNSMEVVSFNLNVERTSLSQITANYYPSGEVDSTGNINPNENESSTIVPDQQGLLKINLYPEINNADYIVITTSSENAQYIGYKQYIGNVDYELGEIKSYEQIQQSLGIYEKGNEKGVKLINQSLSVGTQGIQFNGNLYVGIVLSKNAPQNSSITFNIRAFKNNSEIEILSIQKTLNIIPLPRIEMFVNGTDKEYVVASGNSVNLNVNLFNYNIETEGEIQFSNFSTFVSGSTEKVRVEKVSNTSYKIVSDSDCPVGNVIVTGSITKTLNGFSTMVEDSVTIKFVKYKLQSVAVENVASGVMEVLNGVTNPLSVTLNAEYNSENATEVLSQKSYLEKLAAGREYFNGEETYNNWYAYTGNTSTQLVIGADYKDINFSRITTGNSVAFAIKGIANSSNYNTQLRFEIKYTYNDKTGFPEIITSNDNVSEYYSLTFDFAVYVKDNSTYDHPNPITTVEQLKNMQAGADYILLNDLVLYNWTPIDFVASSLDGNGFRLILDKFDFSPFNGSSSISAGIFSSVANKSVLKNITVDIGNILISKDEVNAFYSEGVDKIPEENSYINLTQFNSVTFGTLAGTNSGTITNCKVISSSMPSSNSETYDNKNTIMHVFTNRSPQITNSVVGGLVGINNGSINNSYVGTPTQSDSNANNLIKTISVGVANKDSNTNAMNSEFNVYPFFIAGSSYVGGFVATNSGIITNSYTSSLGLINLTEINTNNQTAGFVVTNSSNAEIINSFAQGTNIENYRATDTNIYISTKGNLGGFVFNNAGTINNAFSNVATKQNSGNSGGFVFQNSGTIKNAYTTSKIAQNSNLNGNFTGLTSGNFNNSGVYENCYYMVLPTETQNEKEPATAIVAELPSEEDVENENSQTNAFRNSGTFNGFLFTSGSGTDGIWKMPSNPQMGPQLITCEQTTFSLRSLVSVQNDIHNYEYSTSNPYGNANNPILINTPEEFVTFLLNNSVNVNVYDIATGATRKVPVFGIKPSSATDGSEIKSSGAYSVRLINNLDFSNIVLDGDQYQVDGKKIKDLIFLGDLDGNGFTISNLSLVETNKDEIKENFGLFNQVGLSAIQLELLNNANENQVVNSVIEQKPNLKNLKFTFSNIDASSVVKVGGIAGSIYGANLYNISVSYTGTVSARNVVGGIAGLIESTSFEGKVVSPQLNEVTVSGLSANTSYHSANGVKTDYAVTNSGYATNGNNKIIFNSYKEYESFTGDGRKTDYFNNLKQIAYAGGIAGVLNAENRESFKLTSLNKDVKYLRDGTDSTIQQLYVKNKLVLLSENAGGLFGYVGNNTLVKNSKLEIAEKSDNNNAYTKIVAYNFAGGIVAENYGGLEKVRVEYPSEIQIQYDAILQSGMMVGYSDIFKPDSVSGVQDISLTAVGGIAGYSEKGSIIDSYSKINVVNNYAKSAGGVIGFAKNNNFLSHVYTTGDVYAQYNIGGIIGTYYSESTDNKLILDYVYGVNAWNTSTNGETSYNFAKNILKPYYLKAVNGAYNGVDAYNFEVKMPLYGNQKVVISADTSDGNYESFEKERLEELSNIFASQTNYIGSIVGRINNANSDAIVANPITSAELQNIIDKARLVQSVNGLSDNQVMATVIGSTFSNAKLENDSVTKVWPSSKKPNVMGSIISYENVESVGSNDNYLTAIKGEEPVKDGYGNQKYVTTTLATNSALSIIANNFQAWEVDAELRSEIATEKASNIWKVEATFPEYISGIYSHVTSISDVESFRNAMQVETKNKTLILAPSSSDYAITLDQNSKVNKTFEGSLLGVTKNEQNPKIIINCVDTNSKLFELFASMQNATIMNVDFEIVIKEENVGVNSFGDNSDSRSKYFGIIARQMISSTFVNNNVSVTINTESGKTSITLTDSGAENFGLLFGNVTSSNVSVVDITCNSIAEDSIGIINSVGNQKIGRNIGVFAGTITGKTTLNYVNTKNFNIYVDYQNVKSTYENYNFGTLAGLVDSSSISNINNVGTSELQNFVETNEVNQNVNVKVQINAEKTVMQIGGVVGHLQSSTLQNVIAYGNLNYSTQDNLTTASVGGVVGYNQNSNLSNIQFNAYIDENKRVQRIANSNITVSSNNTMYVGGIVGLIGNGGLTGSIIEQNNGVQYSANINGANIDVSNATLTATAEIGVGGIVGKAISTSSKTQVNIWNAVNYGEILDNITVQENNTYIGGIVGIINGVNISDVANRNNITLYEDKIKAYIGGIVGSTTKTSTKYASTINNFASYGNIEFSVAGSSGKTTTLKYLVGGVAGSGSRINITNGYFVGKLINFVSTNSYLNGITTNEMTNYSDSRDSSKIYYILENVLGGDNKFAVSIVNFRGYSVGELIVEGIVYKNLATNGSAFVGKGDFIVPVLKTLPDLKLNEYSYLNFNNMEVVQLSTDNVATIENNKTTLIVGSGKIKMPTTFNGMLIGVKDSQGNYPTIELGANSQLLETNDGSIVNISVKIDTQASLKNKNTFGILANTNTINGYISNVVVYGYNNEALQDVDISAFVYTNKGKILNSGSSVWLMGEVSGNSTLYALMNENLEQGYVDGMFSTSQFMNYKTGAGFEDVNEYAIKTIANLSTFKNVYIAGYFGMADASHKHALVGTGKVTSLSYDSASCGLTNQTNATNTFKANAENNVLQNFGNSMLNTDGITIPTSVEFSAEQNGDVTISSAYVDSTEKLAILSERMLDSWKISNITSIEEVVIIKSELDGANINYKSSSGTTSINKDAKIYGNNRKIKNIIISGTNGSGVGLFASNTKEISDLTLENITVKVGNSTSSPSGVLVGSAEKSKIDNIVLINGRVEGSSNVGLLVGKATGSTISNIKQYGVVSATGENVGGVVGNVDNSTLTNIYSTTQMAVTGAQASHQNIGGIAGNSSVVTFNNVYNFSENTENTNNLIKNSQGENRDITAKVEVGVSSGNNIVNQNIGGIIGNSNNITLQNVYNYAPIIANAGINVGGIVGCGNISNKELSNTLNIKNYADVTGVGVVGGIVGKLTSNLTVSNSSNNSTIINSGSVYAKENKNNIPSNNTNYNGKYAGGIFGEIANGVTVNLSALSNFNNAFMLNNAEGLYVSAGTYAGGFVGINNGAISGKTEKTILDLSSKVKLEHSITTLNSFISVVCAKNNGTISNIKTAEIVEVIDGSNNVIGLNISKNYVGAVAAENNGIISNCENNVSINASSYSAGVIASNNGSISNSLNSGNISGGNYIGGVVAINNKGGVLSTLTNTANIKGGENVGGVVGCIDSSDNAVIIGNLTNGMSNQLKFVIGSTNVGGIVGLMNGNALSTAKLTNYANINFEKSSISSDDYANKTGVNIGGIVGRLNAEITLMLNSGEIILGNEAVGGLVGYADTNAKINSSNGKENAISNVSLIIGTKFVGGAVGKATANLGLVKVQKSAEAFIAIIMGVSETGGILGGFTMDNLTLEKSSSVSEIIINYIGSEKEVFITDPIESFTYNFMVNNNETNANEKISLWNLVYNKTQYLLDIPDGDIIGPSNVDVVKYQEAGRRVDHKNGDPNKDSHIVTNSGSFDRVIPGKTEVYDNGRLKTLNKIVFNLGLVCGTHDIEGFDYENNSKNSYIEAPIYSQRWAMRFNSTRHSETENTFNIYFAMYKAKVALVGQNTVEINELDTNVDFGDWNKDYASKCAQLSFVSNWKWNETDNFKKSYLKLVGNSSNWESAYLVINLDEKGDVSTSKSATATSWKYINE